MNTAEQEQALRVLFQGLPDLLPEQRPLIPQVANRFLCTCRRMHGAHRRQAELGLRIRGTKRGLAELDALAKLLDKVSTHINSLSVDALQAYRGGGLASLAEELTEFIPAVKAAHTRLAEEPEPVRLRKPYAAAITKQAKKLYAELTGKVPGRVINPDTGEPTGRFYRFLDELFCILNIDASAASQISLLHRKRK